MVVGPDLDHQDADQILDRVGPVERPVGAAPGIAADGQRIGRRGGVGQHAEAEPEAVPAAADVDRPVPDVVADHVVDGHPPEQPRTVQLAAVGDHPGEPVVVGGGPRQAGDAPEHPGRLAPGRGDQQFDLAVLVRPVDGRHPLHLLARHVVVRVGHPQGFEDPLAQEGVERLAGDLLHEHRDVVGRIAVLPPVARVERARYDRGVRHPLGQRRPALAAVGDLRDLLRGQPPALRIQGQPGRVGQHVAHGDRARFRLHHRPDAVAVDAHQVVLVLGDPLRDRIVEQEPPLLEQHHQRGRDDRLGHRHQDEDGVLRHRHAVLPVAPAVRLEVDHLPLAGDQGDRAGDPAVIDVLPDEAVDPLQALRRHADRLRAADDDVLGRARRRRRQQHRGQHRADRRGAAPPTRPTFFPSLHVPSPSP